VHPIQRLKGATQSHRREHIQQLPGETAVYRGAPEGDAVLPTGIVIAFAQCDPALLAKYTRILKNKRDFAVVLVESGGHCGGCHMKLPPQVIHDARNPQKIVGCNFCGRIVYNPAP